MQLTVLTYNTLDGEPVAGTVARRGRVAWSSPC